MACSLSSASISATRSVRLASDFSVTASCCSRLSTRRARSSAVSFSCAARSDANFHCIDSSAVSFTRAAPSDARRIGFFFSTFIPLTPPPALSPVRGAGQRLAGGLVSFFFPSQGPIALGITMPCHFKCSHFRARWRRRRSLSSSVGTAVRAGARVGLRARVKTRARVWRGATRDGMLCDSSQVARRLGVRKRLRARLRARLLCRARRISTRGV